MNSLRVLRLTGERVARTKDEMSVGSHFGARERTSRELLAVTFGISNPQHRLITSPSYTPSLSYAIAPTLWTLMGSEDLEMISFYNQRGRSFSDDGRTVPSAPGKHIFYSDNGDQFAAAIDRVRKDLSTRRAMVQLYLPKDTRVQISSSIYFSTLKTLGAAQF